jgi:hypothetical protein
MVAETTEAKAAKAVMMSFMVESWVGTKTKGFGSVVERCYERLCKLTYYEDKK